MTSTRRSFPHPAEVTPAERHVAAILRVAARPCVVTIGTFDGVHPGHRSLIAATRATARERGLSAVALTFWPRPDQVLSEGAPPSLCSLEERLRRLEAAGADLAVAIPFTRALAEVTAERFVHLLTTVLEARALCVGPEFTLGRGRRGSVPELRRLGMEVLTPDLVRARDGAKLSSSTMRRERDRRRRVEALAAAGARA